MSTEARLRELGIDLSDIPPPIADGYIPRFAPWIRSGGHIFLSGRLAKTGDQLLGKWLSLLGVLAPTSPAIAATCRYRMAGGHRSWLRQLCRLLDTLP